MKKTLMIRHFIIAQMYRAGNSSFQIMSARELAKHFDVALSTVSLAIKELTDEGYLFSRPGIGNFTNPSRMPISLNREMPLLVGLMVGDGRFFFMAKEFWQYYRRLVDAIFRAGWNLRPIELSGPVDAEAAREIQDNRIDALIWVGAYKQYEFIDELERLKIPMVTDSPFFPKVNSVSAGRGSQVRALLEYAISHEYHQLLLWLPEEILEVEVPILREEAARRSWPVECEFLTPERMIQGTFLKNYFAGHSKVLGVADPLRVASDLLPHSAELRGAQIEMYRYGAGIFDGKPAEYCNGPNFVNKLTSRLGEILAGDTSIQHHIVERELFPWTESV